MSQVRVDLLGNVVAVLIQGALVMLEKSNSMNPDLAEGKSSHTPQEGQATDLEKLLDQLSRFSVSTETWGRNGAKELSDLLEEIKGGEARLIERDGELVRQISVARISVTGIDADSQTYRLVEDRQVFNYGAQRRRPTPSAVWEKRFEQEEPGEAAIRGLKEELSLTGLVPVQLETTTMREAAMDYPGIPTELTNYNFSLELNISDPNEGFCEVGEKKTTYFSWRGCSAALDSKVDTLLALTTAELQARVLALASQCHEALIGYGVTTDEGIVISEPFSSGRIAEALSSFDGSSKYLRGALYPSFNRFTAVDSQRDIPFTQINAVMSQNLLAYVEGNHLTGSLALTNGAVVNLPYGVELTYGCGEKQETIFLQYDVNGPYSEAEFVSQCQEIAALLVLEELYQKYASSTRSSPDDNNPRHASSDINLKTKELNQESWSIIAPILISSGDKIVVGESFTFGKIARLMSQWSGGSILLDQVYGWYDSGYKLAVGVLPEMVSDERIAEPETVTEGARGLIRHLSPAATVAIATSGWANYWVAGKPDQFSVSCLIATDSGMISESIRFEVASTQEAPLDFIRRERTRELGVTAALYALCDALKLRSASPQLAQVERRLYQELIESGSLEKSINRLDSSSDLI